MEIFFVFLASCIAVATAEMPLEDQLKLRRQPSDEVEDHQSPKWDECWNTVAEDGTYGFCEAEGCCEGSFWISNLCPHYPADWRCCFSSNSCATRGGCTSTCSDADAQSYACGLLDMYEKGQVYLKPNHFNNAGNNPFDGASVLSNIKDTCLGMIVKRSSYSCAEGSSPGGCICLTSNMLAALWTYATNYYANYGLPISVNALAGSCHSSNSWHYRGNTFDVACTTPTNHCSALVDFVRQYQLNELCYPGGPCSGHDTWVHAVFA